MTSEEAAARRARFGPNDPAPRARSAIFVELALSFANPLVIILLLAATAAAFLREPVDAGLIGGIVVLSAAINFAQTFRSRRAVERLRSLVAPTALTLRDGEWREVPRRELVPGDRVRLTAGDLVPADARLAAARDLFVQEAALTGESMPVERPAGEPIFLGTSVVSGSGEAEVEATGPRTRFGAIAARLSARAPATEMEHGLRRFGLLILRVVIFLVLFILVASLAMRRDPLQSLLFAVALAVGLTPEFLPMIITVTLAGGALRMARSHVVVKHLPAIQNLGSIDVLCSDKTGTLTTGEMTLTRATDALGHDSDRPLDLGALNSRFDTGIKSPLDAAVLRRRPAAPSTPPVDDGWRKLDEIPFDFQRRRVSILVEREHERLLVTKGAPESLLPLCVAYETGSERHLVDEVTRAKLAESLAALSSGGQRLLGVAWRASGSDTLSHSDEHGLTLAGYLAFADPPRDDAAETLAALARDGVQVKILTGDSLEVARHVCSEVGFAVSGTVLGDQLDDMTDAALGHVAENANLFARVSPAHKSRILVALKHRSHVVGFLGDGINDAPSLHIADVGISVSSAAEVARDAADVILMQPGLAVLHQGILAGRHAFGNVNKYLLMGTSSNFGNMVSMAAASLFLPFLPMLPTQILLNNLLYDLAQLTIPSDSVDEDYLRRPRRWDLRALRNFMLTIGPLSSIYDFITFWALLKVFHADERLFHSGWFVESLATQTLVLFVIRTNGNPFKSRPSWPLALTTLAVVVVGLVLPFSPLGPWLGFVPLPAAFYGFVAVATATYLLLVEAVKRRLS